MPTTPVSRVAPPISALDANWLKRAIAFKMWVDKNGRLPRQSGVEEPEEKSLGRWLATQIRVAAGKRASVETVERRERWLDRNVPGWNTTNARESARKRKTHRSFDARVLALGRFTQKHGRLPKINGTAANEAWLATFLSNCRSQTAYPKLTPSQEARIDRAAPGWRTPREYRKAA